MLKAVGMVIALLGLWLMSGARREEGCVGALFFLLALALCVIGLYLAFVEDGQGAARWLPFLKP